MMSSATLETRGSGKGTSFYAAASGDGESPLDPVEEFQVQDWLEDLEQKRREVGAAAAWLP